VVEVFVQYLFGKKQPGCQKGHRPIKAVEVCFFCTGSCCVAVVAVVVVAVIVVVIVVVVVVVVEVVVIVAFICTKSKISVLRPFWLMFQHLCVFYGVRALSDFPADMSYQHGLCLTVCLCIFLKKH